ncbi:non-homologous end-joining factor 1-like [Liolophura sinensis]|uniref:non-homologous end-joining factor 1-like n=1 Tax=Liolophura sinensis TaxID=3198878 RepID=UPI003158DCAB
MTTELQWRRTWKPDLRACPWQQMEIDGNTYLIKSRFTEDSYEVMLTDLTVVWLEQLAEGAVKKRIKKLNPSVEAQVTKILDHIQSNLETPSRDTELSVGFTTSADSGDADTEKMRLTVSSKLAGMPFLWHFNGEPVAKEVVSEHLTFPLLAMVGEMFRRQEELIKVIFSKDKEIADYKSQGVKTSRKHYETIPFDETAFRHNMVTSVGFEGQVRSLGVGAFAETGQDLYHDIMTKHAWLNRSPSTGEGTDSLSDETSLDQPIPSSAGTSWGNRLPPSLAQVSPKISPQKSPQKSPTKSPGGRSTPEDSPAKDTELLRRKALEKRLLEEEAKKESKAKKKKKIAF